MNFFVLVGAAALVIWLIIRSLSKRDVAAEDCAKEVIQLLRKDKDANTQEIAEVYQAHSRTKEDIDKVTPLIKARLAQAHIRKDDQPDVMQRVRQAKSLLEK